MGMDLLLLFLLTAINGFFALAEIALVTARLERLEKMKSKGVWGAVAAVQLTGDPKHFLSTIQVGITLVVLAMGVFSGTQLALTLEELLLRVGLPGVASEHLALVLSLVFITYVSIVLGELVPKTVALSQPESISCRIAPIVLYLSYIFFPFVKLLSVSTGLITRLMGVRQQEQLFTSAELRQMVRVASDRGVIADEQKILHEKVFYFADKRAKHLMTHKEDMECVNLLQSSDEIHSQILQFQHSKIICIKGSLSQIEGIIKQREYLKAYATQPQPQLSDLMYEAKYLDENMTAEEVLQYMRTNTTNVCLVTQAGNHVVGLITLSDIFEALIGRMATEGAPYEPPVYKRKDGSYLINGEAPVELLEELIPGFSIDFNRVNYSSVGGFVIANLKKRPEIGDRMMIKNHKLEIVDIDGHIIDKVLLGEKGTG
jgi:putative hemolysin